MLSTELSGMSLPSRERRGNKERKPTPVEALLNELKSKLKDDPVQVADGEVVSVGVKFWRTVDGKRAPTSLYRENLPEGDYERWVQERILAARCPVYTRAYKVKFAHGGESITREVDDADNARLNGQRMPMFPVGTKVAVFALPPQPNSTWINFAFKPVVSDPANDATNTGA